MYNDNKGGVKEGEHNSLPHDERGGPCVFRIKKNCSTASSGGATKRGYISLCSTVQGNGAIGKNVGEITSV